MVTNSSAKSWKGDSTVPRMVKLFLCLLFIFLLTGAQVDFSGPATMTMTMKDVAEVEDVSFSFTNCSVGTLAGWSNTVP